MLQVSHCMHQMIGKTLIKRVNCVECGCMRRKGYVVAVHNIKASGAIEV
jgi:hypothetical protein